MIGGIHVIVSQSVHDGSLNRNNKCVNGSKFGYVHMLCVFVQISRSLTEFSSMPM